MLTPDYQEFANQARGGRRDNTVIWRFRTREAVEIRQALRDCHAKPARKRNFRGEKHPKRPPPAGAPAHRDITGPSCSLSRRLDHRHVLGALLDDLVDDSEYAGVLRGEELVALQRVLDCLVGLAGMLDVDLV